MSCVKTTNDSCHWLPIAADVHLTRFSHEKERSDRK